MWLLISDDLGADNIEVFSSLDQHLSVQCLIQDQMQFITCVYASTLPSLRCRLWIELEYLSSLISSNWFVLGDFNACFGSHEKLGRAPNARSCMEFASAMSRSSLSCLDTKGPLFTWTNKRQGAHWVDIHLDHAFCSDVSFQN